MPRLTIPKNYNDAEVLFEADLDDFKDSTEELLNDTLLDSDNFQLEGITASTKIVNATITNSIIAVDAIQTTTIDSAAVTTAKLIDDSVGTAQVQDGAVTRAKLEAVNIVYGSDFSNSSINPVGSTLSTLSITTTGRPVIIMCVPDSSGDSNFEIYTPSSTPSQSTFFMKCVLNSDATTLGHFPLGTKVSNPGTTNEVFQIPLSSIFAFDVPSAGAHTYSLVTSLISGTSNSEWRLSIKGRLVAYEVM